MTSAPIALLQRPRAAASPSAMARHPGQRLRVLLVCMPWASLDMPSLGLSVLTPVAAGAGSVDDVDVLYANIRWAEHVYRASDERIGSKDYEDVVNGYYVATGEWIFSSALYGREDPAATAFFAAARRSGADLAAACEMYRLAPGFVEATAADVVAGGYDVVGLTSTFDQNMPSLALAAAVKRLDPSVVTVLGGANCDDVQGQALARNFPFLDYVVRGEGEVVLPRLLDAVGAADPALLPSIEGLCWRDDRGRLRTNQATADPVPVDAVPEPVFDAYFDEFWQAPVCRDVPPKVVVEGGRGCWWGEKHHCTFCGLNGSLMRFRSKEPDRILGEIGRAVERHRVLDIVFADNILDMRYLPTLLPALGDTGWDLRLFFEVKSNLDFAQLVTLADGGVTQIQPGVESLSSQVLRLMRKGVTGWQNVRLLRDCRTLAIYPGWNLLYGFPGETAKDYEAIVHQVRHMVHLVPPEGVYRVVLTRFSPFFTDPSLGLDNLGPSGMLSAVYDLPPEELADLVYVFESPERGITGASVDLVREAFGWWKDHHRGRRLVAVDEGPVVRIVDERDPGATREHVLDHPVEADAYRALLRGLPPQGLCRALERRGHSPASIAAVGAVLERWRADGLVFSDGGYDVALATGLAWS